MDSERSSCVFCRIADHAIPAHIRFEDDEMMAFDDANPNAPIHVLLISKAHLASLVQVEANHQELLGKMLYRCKLLADELNISDSGYRVTINVGDWGGQIVRHLHLHILGGAPLTSNLAIGTAEKSKQMTKEFLGA